MEKTHFDGFIFDAGVAGVGFEPLHLTTPFP